MIGAAGNRALGAMVVKNARSTFGPPPRFWDIDGTVLPFATKTAIEGN